MPGEPQAIGLRSDGLALHGVLRICGDAAPTIVLLSGLGFHTFEYEPLAERLAAAGLGSVSFDFRGHGRSDGPRGRWTMAELVADTRQAIGVARAHSRGPVCLFGNSLGAMVAIAAGAQDDRVLGVVASNCPARVADFLMTGPRRTLFALAKLVAPVVPLRVSVDRFYAYEQLIDDPRWVAAIRRDPLIADARRLAVPALRTLIDEWDGCSAVGGLRKPLLLIQGGRDELQPPRQSELLLAAAPARTRYEVIDTGHLPHLERPEMVAALVAAWLAEVTQGAASRAQS